MTNTLEHRRKYNKTLIMWIIFLFHLVSFFPCNPTGYQLGDFEVFINTVFKIKQNLYKALGTARSTPSPPPPERKVLGASMRTHQVSRHYKQHIF